MRPLVQDLYTQMGKGRINDRSFDNFFAQVDRDRSGRVSKNELKLLIKLMMSN